jgi:hypothetical protein
MSVGATACWCRCDSLTPPGAFPSWPGRTASHRECADSRLRTGKRQVRRTDPLSRIAPTAVGIAPRNVRGFAPTSRSHRRTSDALHRTPSPIAPTGVVIAPTSVRRSQRQASRIAPSATRVIAPLPRQA